MFTGIIETLGKVERVETQGTNLNFTISSGLAAELKIDQSVAHNGVCLTVTNIDKMHGTHTVTAVKETLDCTHLSLLKPGDKVNLERCTGVGSRLDGHIVQGHVDQTAVVSDITNLDGSYMVFFLFDSKPLHTMVPKGSVTVNGVSLTVVDVLQDGFSVTIIPYTWEHTNFHVFTKNTRVNIEFDIIGKYLEQLMNPYLNQQ